MLPKAGKELIVVKLTVMLTPVPPTVSMFGVNLATVRVADVKPLIFVAVYYATVLPELSTSPVSIPVIGHVEVGLMKLPTLTVKDDVVEPLTVNLIAT